MEIVGIILALVLFGLAVLHLYWAAGGRFGIAAAIPEVDGVPVFTPSAAGTVAVACILVGFALVALALGFPVSVPEAIAPYSAIAGFTVGGLLVLRAVGEFRYVGFFKRVKGSTFATYDSWVFSPFCLVAGGGFIALGAAGS